MSDLDYELTLAERAAIRQHIECEPNHKKVDFVFLEVEDILHRRLLDLAQRAEADRAAVERVRALVDSWAEGADHWGVCTHEWTSLDKLRAALDRKEDQ